MNLNLGHELTVDLFAGGGGASLGIERGMGRPVDIAVNHDADAVAMHEINHPETRHFCESVFSVDPVAVTGNLPVGLLWASPDCTHHSKAKGGKPVSNKRRGLAWVVIRWARRTRPRVIMLENVEEFEDWGPLTPDNKPCPLRKGATFQRWVAELERAGYRVEWRRLRACDFGAPTIRRRLFVIARRDGLPIIWPEPTRGAGLLPYRTAAECIDWSIPCPSIFERKRPLAENTLRRIARGVVRFVLEAAEPFIVGAGGPAYAGKPRSTAEPINTLLKENHSYLVVPTVMKNMTNNASRGVNSPLSTILTGNHQYLVSAFLAKHYGGNYTGPGIDLRDPAGTVTTVDHHGLVAAHMLSLKGSDRRASAATEPARTVCAGGGHAAVVAAFLSTYYGNGAICDPREPAHTVTTKDRLQLITVTIDGESYILTDIGMRMLTPRELFRAQGFPDDYIIDRGPDGRRLTKTAQVRLCGNSVPPVWPEAMVRANIPADLRGEEAA